MVSVGPTVPPSGHAGHHGAALGLELGAGMFLTHARLRWSPQAHYANYVTGDCGRVSPGVPSPAEASLDFRY